MVVNVSRWTTAEGDFMANDWYSRNKPKYL